MGRRTMFLAVTLVVMPAFATADEVRWMPQQLAERIDRPLATSWAVDQVQPAPAASDSEFVRRVYLDLIGRIPRVSETREFLNDPAPDKRTEQTTPMLQALANGTR